MNTITKYLHYTERLLLILLAFFGNLPLFTVSAVFVAVYLLMKTWFATATPPVRRVLKSALILAAMILQIVFYVTIVFTHVGVLGFILRAGATLVLPLPLLITSGREDVRSTYLPWAGNLATISFTQLREQQTKIANGLHKAESLTNARSRKQLLSLFEDLHRHSATHYINRDSLDADYFKRAEAALSDPYLYLVISNTGSPASELIGLFTQRLYNHASLSFDAELSTIISYNGGANVYPPGLNPEMIAEFHQKPDASVLVYRLPVTPAQKRKVYATVSTINQDGSAYNILGLVTKRSLRRNIMFCSQFVYRMLEIADATYFTKRAGDVQPMDFVENDLYRKLEFVKQITF